MGLLLFPAPDQAFPVKSRHLYGPLYHFKKSAHDSTTKTSWKSFGRNFLFTRTVCSNLKSQEHNQEFSLSSDRIAPIAMPETPFQTSKETSKNTSTTFCKLPLGSLPTGTSTQRQFREEMEECEQTQFTAWQLLLSVLESAWGYLGQMVSQNSQQKVHKWFPNILKPISISDAQLEYDWCSTSVAQEFWSLWFAMCKYLTVCIQSICVWPFRQLQWQNQTRQ